MKSNLLLNKICLIQNEYKSLLALLLPKLKNSYAPEVLDEINLFWFRHMGEIQLYLKNWFSGENSYVFTADTHMGFDDNEHLPFLLMGDKLVFDDPLSKYSEIQREMPKGKTSEYLYQQIRITAEDNLKLLENVSERILILPLSISNQTSSFEYLYELGEHVFINLFKDINDLSDYFNKCSSIDDIIQYAHNNIEKLIVFSENDDTTLPFKDRFRTAVAEMQYMVDPNKTDSENFIIIVFGYIQQAISVIVSCVELGCFPYIRNSVSLNYILLLSESMLDIKQINMHRFKASVAFAVYQLFDYERFSAIHLDEFLKKSQKYKFSTKLFETLKKHDVTESNFTSDTIIQVVGNELSKFYNMLIEKVDSDENEIIKNEIDI